MIIAKGNLTGNLINKQSIRGIINKATEYIRPTTQVKIITPTKQIQEVLPDENIDMLSKVTVNAIPDDYIIPEGQKEITENGISDVTQYKMVNINVPLPKIYLPDWSEIGYENTPENIINSFNYSKEIKNTWNNNVTNLRNKFYSNKNLIYMPFVDTSKANNMNSMFNGCSSLIHIPLLDTSKVTDMGGMFRSCSSLINIPKLNTSNVTIMPNMFHDCTSITSIPLLDTSKVTNIGYMFYRCSNLITVPQFDTSSVTYINNIFDSCYKLSDSSINNILAMCINAISYTGTKTLRILGLYSSYYPASRIQALSNYQAFLDAGWTIGY